MFTHPAESHLWKNVIAQMIIGSLLESVHHWKRVGTVYMIGVLGGSMAVSIIDPKSYVEGCSAGVYALGAAHWATLIMNWHEMKWSVLRLIGLILLFLDQIYTFYQTTDWESRFNPDATKPKISHSGHIGGAIAGFLIAVCVLKNFRASALKVKFQEICLVIFTLLFMFVALFNLSFPSYYYTIEKNRSYLATKLKSGCVDNGILFRKYPELCQIFLNTLDDEKLPVSLLVKLFDSFN